MINKIIFYLSGFILLNTGCNNLTKQIQYYDNGEIKEIYFTDNEFIKQGTNIEYYPSGNMSFTSNYTQGKFMDTLFFYFDNVKNTIKETQFSNRNGFIFYKKFHSNGNLHRIGLLNGSGQRTGIWKNYDQEGNHSFTKEYKIIEGKEFTNQMWVTLPSGDTLTEGVSMRYYFDKNTLRITDSIYCFFQIEDSAFNSEQNIEKAKVTVTLPKDYSKENFLADFANRPYFNLGKEIKAGIDVISISSVEEQKSFDTIDSINKEDYKKTVVFYWKPLRLGKDTIRGYFTERVFVGDSSTRKVGDNEITEYSKDFYFDFPVEVID